MRDVFEFDRANLQILCKDCNRTKTRVDIAAIAAVRRENKRIIPGQTVLGFDKNDQK